MLVVTWELPIETKSFPAPGSAALATFPNNFNLPQVNHLLCREIRKPMDDDLSLMVEIDSPFEVRAKLGFSTY